MLIECIECGRQISDRAIACPGCGCPTSLMIADPAPTGTPKPTRAARTRHRLPNGWGTIKKLSGRRARPYAAYPPVKEFHLNGSPVQQPAIGYYATYSEAYDALATYRQEPYDLKARKLTFAQIYERWYAYKYVDSKRKYSNASMNSTRAAYHNSSALHNRIFDEIRVDDLQRVVDGCPLKHSSLELIVSLFREMWVFANQMEYTTKNPAQYVRINIPEDDERGEPFTEDELRILWQNTDKEEIRILLILCYSGFRIAALHTLEINLQEGYMKGGVKTRASKGRVVPIHPAIRPLVEQFEPKRLPQSKIYTFRSHLYATLESLGIARTSNGKKHTPHDGRHTFSWLCDRYGVNSTAKHKLMGHSQGDVEEVVYGHRTIAELRAEIHKIKIPNMFRVCS